MKIAFVYCSIFLLTFGILLFARTVSAEETDINVPTLAEGLDRKELSSRIGEDEKGDSSKWLSWFKKENLAVRTSFFGGRIHHTDDEYLDLNDTTPGALMDNDRFWTGARSIWGGELGVGYKIRYGVELGISYMFMEVNDYGIRTVQRDTGAGALGPWYNKGSMDIASRAAMFNARVYLDDLSGWDMGRFSPYILGSAGRATHKVTDFRKRDDETLNGPGTGIQIYDFSTSHNNKGVFLSGLVWVRFSS